MLLPQTWIEVGDRAWAWRVRSGIGPGGGTRAMVMGYASGSRPPRSPPPDSMIASWIVTFWPDRQSNILSLAALLKSWRVYCRPAVPIWPPVSVHGYSPLQGSPRTTGPLLFR